MKTKEFFKTIAVTLILFISGSMANAQESTGKKYVLKSVQQIYEEKPSGKAVFFEYNDKLHLTEMALWEANWSDLSKPVLIARNKIKTDGQGRISQIDLYEVPSAVSEPIEPYPHIGRIVYEYDNNGKPAKRSVYDASVSLEEPETTATFKHDNEGRLIKIESSTGAYKSWEYNDKGQLVKTQFWSSDPDIQKKKPTKPMFIMMQDYLQEKIITVRHIPSNLSIAIWIMNTRMGS